MRVFIYEYITGGGMCSAGGRPEGSLLREGAAMLRAIVEDFAVVPGTQVVTMRDARLAEPDFGDRIQVTTVASADDERVAVFELSKAADATLLIAPEFQGILLQRARWLEEAGARLISPSAVFIEIASDKQQTAIQLASRGVRVPRGLVAAHKAEIPADFRWPAVIKPRDGAGSLGVRKLRSCDDFNENVDRGNYLEEFCPGMAASCAVLCGPEQLLPLPACEQLLGGASGFEYLGGKLPLSPNLQARAKALALQAIAAMPRCVGYVGVDLVLGNAADGSDDVVIEINPRLTTSYVGLRALCRENLSAAMLAVAEGRPAALSQRPEQVEFTAEGTTAYEMARDGYRRGESQDR